MTKLSESLIKNTSEKNTFEHELLVMYEEGVQHTNIHETYINCNYTVICRTNTTINIMNGLDSVSMLHYL